jgi:hypothetical protein
MSRIPSFFVDIVTKNDTVLKGVNEFLHVIFIVLEEFR